MEKAVSGTQTTATMRALHKPAVIIFILPGFSRFVATAFDVGAGRGENRAPARTDHGANRDEKTERVIGKPNMGFSFSS